MVNGDLSHSTWLAPQPDELSLLQEPRSVSSISHNASAHITATAPQSRQRVGGSVIRCHISLVTLNKKEDVRGKRYNMWAVHLLISQCRRNKLAHVKKDTYIQNSRTSRLIKSIIEWRTGWYIGHKHALRYYQYNLWGFFRPGEPKLDLVVLIESAEHTIYCYSVNKSSEKIKS